MTKRHCGSVPLLALLILLAGPLAAGADDSVVFFQEITWAELIPASSREAAPFLDGALNRYSGHDPAASQALEAYLARRNRSPANMDLDGRTVKIRGFVVPLEWNAESALTEFLLVPYFGACIHVPPPPLNQIIHVQASAPLKGVQAMDNIIVSGRITAEDAGSSAGDAAYRLQAVKAESVGGATSPFARALGLTAFCGLSLCLGAGFTRFLGRKNTRLMGLALGFSGGIMIALALSIVVAKFSLAALSAFAAGVLAMAGLEFWFHQSWRPGKFAALAVAAHNVPECFAIFSLTMANPSLGLALGCAMISHNIPLGFFFGLDGGSSRWRYALTAGLVPIPAAVALYLLARPLLSADNLSLLFSLVGGLMVFIAAREILPSAEQYAGRCLAVAGGCAGIVFMIIMVLIFRG